VEHISKSTHLVNELMLFSTANMSIMTFVSDSLKSEILLAYYALFICFSRGKQFGVTLFYTCLYLPTLVPHMY